MENHASNPAGRLWLYFSDLWTHPDHESAHPYAAAYFGLPAGFSDRYLTAVAALMRLPDEVQALVARIDSPPIPATKLLSPLEAVRTLLQGDPLAQNPISWVKAQINSTVLSELDTTSHILNSYVTKGSAISAGALADIRDLAAQIIELAREDVSLDPEARATFIRYGHRITEAADLYKAAGPQPLIDELDRFHQEARRMSSVPGPKLWEKTKKLTAAVVLAVGLFMVPVDIDNALEYYEEAFTQQDHRGSG